MSRVDLDIDGLDSCAGRLLQLSETLAALASRTRGIASHLRDGAWPDPKGWQTADEIDVLARGVEDTAGVVERRQSLLLRKVAQARAVLDQAPPGSEIGPGAGTASAAPLAAPGADGDVPLKSATPPWTPTGVPEEYAKLVDRATRLDSGRKGAGWNAELNSPKPNTAYIVDNKFLFVTDDRCRTVFIKTTLTEEARLATAEAKLAGVDRRNETEQRRAGTWHYDAAAGEYRPIGLDDGIEGRGKFDDGGHLIAAMFGGIGEAINVVAQHQTVNRSRTAFPRNWYAAESAVKTMLKNPPHLPVQWEAEILYEPNSARPSLFKLRFRQQGSRARTYTIENP